MQTIKRAITISICSLSSSWGDEPVSAASANPGFAQVVEMQSKCCAIEEKNNKN
jgi:hypothetical protein